MTQIDSVQGSASEEVETQSSWLRAAQFDFFQAVRQIEQLHRDMPRVGRAAEAAREPVRISQAAELDCAPSTVSSIRDEGGVTHLTQRFFGLMGPQGPLPIHVSEQVRDRSRHQHDPATEAFLNVFTHRMAVLFYRAWAQSRGAVQHDRPDEDRFGGYLRALSGAMTRRDAGLEDATRARDAESDQEGETLRLYRAFFAGRYSPVRRNAEGLTAVLSAVLRVEVRVDEFALQWLPLEQRERTYLQSRSSSFRGAGAGDASLGGGVLGESAVLGRRVPDRTGRIHVSMGPVDAETFAALIPGGREHVFLKRLVRSYIGMSMSCRVTIKVLGDDVPGVRLGQHGAIGLSGWLGATRPDVELTDCHFDV